MSGANVESVRRAWDAWQRGDVDGVLEAVDASVITRRVAPLPDPEPYHGHEGLLRWGADWMESFGEFDLVVEGLVDAGETVLAQVYQRAVGRGSGASVEARFWFVHTFAGGKLIQLEAFASETQARAAAGLGTRQ